MHNKNKLAVSIATVLATAGSGTALAQQSGSESHAIEEITVTAQRRSENIQDVPMSVTAVTGEKIQDYNLTRFEDLQQLSPGLQLDNNGAFGSVAQLRGVGFDSNSSASPAVDIYVNEIPVDANYAFQSIYDVQQVEVLRGPQGTLRGRPAPGGAITFTSRRPDLNEWGASIVASASDQSANNAQVAVNAPLIEDKLALRVATLYDEDEGNRVKSVNSNAEESRETRSWRTSLRWTPTDSLDAVLTHQYLKSDRVVLAQVEGDGVGYNGPSIGERGYSVLEGESGGWQEFKFTSLNLSWDLGEHVVSYTAGRQDNEFKYGMALDITNAVTDWDQLQSTVSSYKIDTHELKLESVGDNAIDYVVGLWYADTETATSFAQPAPLSGAFGNPLAPSPTDPVDMDYVLGVNGDIPISSKDYAIYSNAVYHVAERTDLSVGVRYLQTKSERSERIATGSALNAAGIVPGVPLAFVPQIPGGCFGLTFVDPNFTGNEPFPGYCDYALQAGEYTSNTSEEDDAWVYTLSLKHYVTDDMMAYFSYGTSWRPAGVTTGVTAPVSADLISGDPEESASIELGLRSEWLEGRLRANASIFHQDFDNFVGRFNEVPYVGAGDQIDGSGGFTYPGDAVVDGFELELSYAISDAWDLQLNTAYADGHYDDARVPCRDTNLDGVPDDGDAGSLTAADFEGNSVRYCVVDTAIATTPPWTATLQSEYRFPVLGNEGYVRALYNHYAAQENQGMRYEADSYGVLNLYAGLRGNASPWELGLWAKNILDEDTQLKRGQEQTIYGVFPTGYYSTQYVPERQIGVSLRYSFGDG